MVLAGRDAAGGGGRGGRIVMSPPFKPMNGNRASGHWVTPYRGGVTDPMVWLMPKCSIGSYHRVRVTQCLNCRSFNHLCHDRWGIGSPPVKRSDKMQKSIVTLGIGSERVTRWSRYPDTALSPSGMLSPTHRKGSITAIPGRPPVQVANSAVPATGARHPATGTRCPTGRVLP